MNITKAQVDALNAIVTVAITKEDYSDKVEKVLAEFHSDFKFTQYSIHRTDGHYCT